jgi:hypothetical protein
LFKHEKDVTDALPKSGDRIIQDNMSYWLDIHKHNTCKTHIFEDLANMTSKPTRCLYVKNSYGNGRWENCDEKNHFICEKSGEKDIFGRFLFRFCLTFSIRAVPGGSPWRGY